MLTTITMARWHDGTMNSMVKKFAVLCLCFWVFVVGVRGQPRAEGTLVYVGTYTEGTSKGIYAFRFDQARGALTPVGLVAETRSPSWLALHPSGQYLYAANEVNDVDADKSGGVSAFKVDRTSGALTLLNSQPSRGAHPCHLTVDRQGTHLLVANYTGGTLAVLPLKPDGSLATPSQVVQHKGSSLNTSRQAAPHAHSVDLDADNRFAISSDLGADRLFIYRYDPKGGGLSAGLQPAVAATPGAGPRHFAFHPNGQFGFAINELSSTVTSYAWDARRGALKTLATTSTLPKGYRGKSSTAEIRVHPGGRFLYGSNRGHDSIAVYRISETSGNLTLVEHEPTRGKTPRNFTIDPSGQWLVAANQDSGTLAVFRINDKSGALTPVGPLVNVGSPVSVVFAK